jgi:hypothetical protein
VYHIVKESKFHQEFHNCLSLATLKNLLTDREIEDVCSQFGHTWRSRKLPPGITVRSMVYRGLSPDQSIAASLLDLAAALPPNVAAPTDSAWCQARNRIPEEVLLELIIRKAHVVRRRFGCSHRCHDRWVFVVDGSSVSMPDEPPLVKAFGYANTRHGPSRFPVARITFIELAGLEVIWNYRLDKYTCDEDRQFHDMWHTLPGGCICLMDRRFCSFYNLAKLRQRRIGVVTRLHQRRNPLLLIRRGIRFAKNEWIVPLDLAPQIRQKYDDPSLPGKLWVRLIRVSFKRGHTCHRLWLVTTLMDPDEYPRREIEELYRRRWGIEPRIGSLKTTLQMDVLRGKSPCAVRREVASIILGHNLVWALIHEAAEKTGTPAKKISFAGAVKVTLAFSHSLRQTHRLAYQCLYNKMLLQIAKHINHHPPERVEPRLVKRDRIRYAALREPRWKARLKCLS